MRVACFLVLLTSLLIGCGGVSYNYRDRQLGRRTWEVTSTAPTRDATNELARFVLYRAAELTRGLGYRYFAVRQYDGDAADYRSFAIAGGGRDASPLPSVADVSARSSGPSPGGHVGWSWVRTLKFRILDPSEVGDGSTAIDADKIFLELAPLIERRR